MRMGGWLRLWIAVSFLWVIGALALNIPGRPTSEKVARDVALACDMQTPMTEEYARDALEMRDLLDQLVVADRVKDEKTARRIAAEINSLRLAWARKTGVPVKYSRFPVLNPDGTRSPTQIAPLPAFNVEDSDKINANNWAGFSSYCVDEIRQHAKGELRRARMNDWMVSTSVGVLSFPIVALILGLLIGWIWRGFRPKKNNAESGV